MNNAGLIVRTKSANRPAEAHSLSLKWSPAVCRNVVDDPGDTVAFIDDAPGHVVEKL